MKGEKNHIPREGDDRIVLACCALDFDGRGPICDNPAILDENLVVLALRTTAVTPPPGSVCCSFLSDLFPFECMSSGRGAYKEY